MYSVCVNVVQSTMRHGLASIHLSKIELKEEKRFFPCYHSVIFFLVVVVVVIVVVFKLVFLLYMR